MIIRNCPFRRFSDALCFFVIWSVILGLICEAPYGAGKSLTMGIFLSQGELVEMTGYQQPARQIHWLVSNGYNFDIRSDHRPNVLWDQVRERQCKTVERTPGPDLGWLDETG